MSYRLAAATVVGLAAAALFSFANAQQQQPADASRPVPSMGNAASGGGRRTASALPPPPAGAATVIGGVIRSVDPVRDAIRLKVFGGKTMDILFDPRTQAYRDGKRVPLRDLRAGDHASVETVLDGTNIYAISVHMLSHAPEGDVQGQVLDYDPSSGELTVSAALARESVKLKVPASARIVREGRNRNASAHSRAPVLESGDLVSVTFTPGGNGRGVASEVVVLATPGSTFLFNGSISVLDLHSGLLVLRNASDNRVYRLHFNPLVLPMTKFHEGDQVRVKAKFNGSRYEASSITPKS